MLYVLSATALLASAVGVTGGLPRLSCKLLWPQGLPAIRFIGTPPLLANSVEGRFCIKISTPQKNRHWGDICGLKCSKVTPKASKMEPWPVILTTFFAKSRLCIRLHIYYVFDTFYRFWTSQF